MKRQDEEARWNAEWVKAVKGTPQQPDPNKPGMRIPVQVNFDPPEEGEVIEAEELRKEGGMRRMKITKDLLETFGYTEGCEGCRRKRADIKEQRPHTEECRRNLWERMEETMEGRRKKEKEEVRIDVKISESMERGEKREEEDGPERDKDGKRRRVETSEDRTNSGGDGERATGSNDPAGSREKGKGRENEGEDAPRAKAPRDERMEEVEEEKDSELDLVMALRSADEKVEVEVMETYSPPRVTEEAKR